MQPQELCNRVYLSGRLEEAPMPSHEMYGEMFYTFPLLVPRLSGTDDRLPVTASARVFSRPQAEDCFPCYPSKGIYLPRQGDCVNITGQLRSYNMHQQGANRLLITAFARSMELGSEADEPRNEVTLTGFICKPVVYRTTPFSREIADMLLAVNRAYHKSDYLPLIAWGRNARFASTLNVGDCICVSGRLQSREYQKKMADDSVVTRTAYEVSVSTLRLI